MLITRDTHKARVRDAFLALAEQAGQPMSASRAARLTRQFKKGNLEVEFAQLMLSLEVARIVQDPELGPVIDYQDETGETATNRLLAEDLAKVVLR
ncbi:hypothetical protein [Rothia halotolerans]|uniref:hypothetical protein n=1 Tax=Rothia halotolerans TaxID=405770 RepID=UPI00101D6E94|nr:hypothetical protein [Rothia halotolerans]